MTTIQQYESLVAALAILRKADSQIPFHNQAWHRVHHAMAYLREQSEALLSDDRSLCAPVYIAVKW